MGKRSTQGVPFPPCHCEPVTDVTGVAIRPPEALRFALCTEQRPPQGETDSHLAVPGKHFGLALFLVFSDRCGNCALAASAPGSARPQFPVRSAPL